MLKFHADEGNYRVLFVHGKKWRLKFTMWLAVKQIFIYFPVSIFRLKLSLETRKLMQGITEIKRKTIFDMNIEK